MPLSNIKIEVQAEDGQYSSWEFPRCEDPILDISEELKDDSKRVRFSFTPYMVEAGFFCIQNTMPEEPHDEYHTMTELYRYRMLYHAQAVLYWLAMGIPVVKSTRHHDGELCFDGEYFIVVADLPTGQVSNHYKMEHWKLFRTPATMTPPEWDGHTPEVAAQRMEEFLKLRPVEDMENLI